MKTSFPAIFLCFLLFASAADIPGPVAEKGDLHFTVTGEDTLFDDVRIWKAK